jgi:hypothetical protein
VTKSSIIGNLTATLIGAALSLYGIALVVNVVMTY